LEPYLQGFFFKGGIQKIAKLKLDWTKKCLNIYFFFTRQIDILKYRFCQIIKKKNPNFLSSVRYNKGQRHWIECQLVEAPYVTIGQIASVGFLFYFDITPIFGKLEARLIQNSNVCEDLSPCKLSHILKNLLDVVK
jgi:hypothetical protein